MGSDIPLDKAISLAFCIIGPSACGSENGIPISIISAPPSIACRTRSSVLSLLGNPAVIKTISLFPSLLNRFFNLLI